MVKSESTYIIVFIPRKLNGDVDMSNSFIIKKFKFQEFSSNAYKEINSTEVLNSYNNRIISAFTMNDYNIFVVFFVNNNKAYTINIYDYNINCLHTQSLSNGNNFL